jgi:hypothetical protein
MSCVEACRGLRQHSKQIGTAPARCSCSINELLLQNVTHAAGFIMSFTSEETNRYKRVLNPSCHLAHNH